RPSQQFGQTNAVWTTGPTAARSGYRYAFIDSSYDVNAAMEVKHSFTGPACVSIGYHMNGNNIGTLSVRLVDENGANEELAWSITGPQGNQWHYTEFDIKNVTNRRIIITADKGNNTPDDEGDIGIDDIMVLNQPCE
ncbi:neuropilin-1-like, partial [Mizuhopecten yessoensis]|uniref:neuropilin-1-like n=1 Tax=Mizuhopecten yessoensis TaxID=6573 RepID=UPI000B45E312